MLYLKKKDYNALLSYCRQRQPQEACGLLAGRNEHGNCYVEMVYFLTNIENSQDRFSMEPREQFAAVKDMRAHGLHLVGNFHSHPLSAAVPSAADKRLAVDRGFRYLIFSLLEKEPELKVFLLEEQEMREEMYVVAAK
ncbi:M67 family metallopeptidase [Lachnospiraceae bacterium 45-W7]